METSSPSGLSIRRARIGVERIQGPEVGEPAEPSIARIDQSDTMLAHQGGQPFHELAGSAVNRLGFVACVDKDVGIDRDAHEELSITALSASLSSRSTRGWPRFLEVQVSPRAAGCLPSSS